MNASSDFSTMVDMIRDRFTQKPDQRAFAFLANGETEQDQLTWCQADEQARAIASRLQGIARAGDRAILIYPQGLEFVVAFLGCLYAGVVPIPSAPVTSSGVPDMLLRIVSDAQPKLILTATGMRAELQIAFQKIPEVETLNLCATDEWAQENYSDDWQQPKLADDALAYLMYTSGSTKMPRGIMISQRSMMRYIRDGHNESKPDDLSVSWMPQYHSSGLGGTVINPLLGGVPVVFMPPNAVTESPIRWLRAISRYKATQSGAPNFAYQLCVERTGREERQGLDLSTWRAASVGAEPTHTRTLDLFAQTFAPYGFRKEVFVSAYGLSESRLYTITMNPKTCAVKRAALAEDQVVLASTWDADATVFVSCGVPTSAPGLHIVDPASLTICAPDRIGEIWIEGRFAMDGYLNKPEETKATFNAHLADGKGPFLRTGDMGFVKDGEVYITGRIKDMIIIRGKNYYAADIEQVAGQSHAALMPGAAAAFGINLNDSEHLAIVHEVKPNVLNVNVDQVAKAVRQAVAREMQLPVHAVMLVKPGSLPRTSAGKIQHYMARERFLAAQNPQENELDAGRRKNG